MWITSRRRRFSCFVPVTLLTLMAAMLGVSVERLLSSPSVGTVASSLVTLGLFLFVAADLRLARDTGSTLVVRSPFGRRELDVATTVVSVVSVSGGRGGMRHEVVATDAGGVRAVLGESFSVRRAERASEKLRDALESLTSRPERERLRTKLAGVRAADDAQRDAAMAQARSYYKTGTHRRTLYVVAALLVLYVVGMAVYVALSGGTL